jgi:hypothetical protein
MGKMGKWGRSHCCPIKSAEKRCNTLPDYKLWASCSVIDFKFLWILTC